MLVVLEIQVLFKLDFMLAREQLIYVNTKKQGAKTA